MNAIVNYVRGAVEELELVRWPTRQQAVRLSGIVIAFTIVNAAFFGSVDVLLSRVIFLITNTF